MAQDLLNVLKVEELDHERGRTLIAKDKEIIIGKERQSRGRRNDLDLVGQQQKQKF
jgi:hypothetical protein